MNKFLSSTALVAITARAFMNDTCKTVQIKDKKGNPITINESDYDEKEHGPLWKPTKANVAKQEKQAAADAPDGTISEAHEEPSEELKAFNERIERTQFGVFGEGRKFFICDSAATEDNKPVVITDMIDPETGENVFDVNGYKDQKTAWAAIQTLRTRITSQDPGFTGNVAMPKDSE